MSQHYSNPDRENDPHALPDVEVFQLTAREYAEGDSNSEMIEEWLRKPQYRLATMNSKTRDAMFDAMIEEEGIEGGWFYWFCFPGCMPEGDAIGPYKTRQEAIAAAQDDAC
jgi:hypothetical protein